MSERRAPAVGWLRALGALAVFLAAASAGGVFVAAPASAAAPCVAVVVDATGAGGSVRTACARTDPATGFAALRAAGFSFRLRPDGLICQINGHPDTCAASTQRYWSYWYRPAGATRWVYSNLGPGARDPGPGSSEGWVFQTDGGQAAPPNVAQATICPPPPKKRKPAAAATSARPTSASAAPRRTTKAAAPASSGTSTSQAASPRAVSPSTAAALPEPDQPTPDTSTTAAPPSDAAPPGDAAPPSDPPDQVAATEPTTEAVGTSDARGGAEPLQLLAAAALIIAIAGAAAARARARR